MGTGTSQRRSSNSRERAATGRESFVIVLLSDESFCDRFFIVLEPPSISFKRMGCFVQRKRSFRFRFISYKRYDNVILSHNVCGCMCMCVHVCVYMKCDCAIISHAAGVFTDCPFPPDSVPPRSFLSPHQFNPSQTAPSPVALRPLQGLWTLVYVCMVGGGVSLCSPHTSLPLYSLRRLID